MLDEPERPEQPRLLSLMGDEDERARGAFAREALIASNPLVSDHPILFVTRKQFRPDHHNTETMFQTGEINTEMPVFWVEKAQDALKSAEIRGRHATQAAKLESGDIERQVLEDLQRVSRALVEDARLPALLGEPGGEAQQEGPVEQARRKARE